jgi:hypothetical protein
MRLHFEHRWGTILGRTSEVHSYARLAAVAALVSTAFVEAVANWNSPAEIGTGVLIGIVFAAVAKGFHFL